VITALERLSRGSLFYDSQQQWTSAGLNQTTMTRCSAALLLQLLLRKHESSADAANEMQTEP